MQHVARPRPEHTREEVANDGEDRVGDEFGGAPWNAVGVQSYWQLLRWVEHHDVLAASLWHAGQDVHGEVGLGVDDHHATACPHICRDEIQEQDGLARSGRAGDDEVLTGIGNRESDRLRLARGGADGEGSRPIGLVRLHAELLRVRGPDARHGFGVEGEAQEPD